MKKHFLYISLAYIISSCATTNNGNNTQVEPQPNETTATNVLLIIADDLGSDAFSSYEIGSNKPEMPNIENLAKSGIRFTNCWAYPTCTPTRSSIITGKHSFRTGMVQVGDVLDTKEVSLQKLITESASSDYNCAVIGKWHLSEEPNHPTQMGVPYYSGLLSGGVRDYSSWNHTTEGKTTRVNEYITSYFTDDAINWIDQQSSKPWFLWLAYTSPHTPFHLPPNDLHSYDTLANTETDIEDNPQPYYFSMIESLDTEIGRLLEAIPSDQLENTVIIFIGDNGSPNQVVQKYGKKKAKGSIYQGGINVPLVISGKNVNRVNDVEDALINSTDLFATIAELTGTGITEVNDSKSLVPIFNSKNLEHKDYLYSELGKKNKSGKTIRDATHKYIQYSTGTEELYDLINDPFERNNLIDDADHSSNLNKLKQKLTSMLGSNTGGNSSGTNTNTFSVSSGIECSENLNSDNLVTISSNSNIRTIQSNGIPNHSVGPFPNSGNPHTLSIQNIEFTIPMNPTKATKMTSLYSESGFGIGRPSFAFGVALNGIKLDPSAAEAFTVSGSKEKNFDWVKEALSSNNRLGDDCNNAHVQPNGEYHYHGTPSGIVANADGKSMFQVGWAADGFPIYYKWGYSDPLDNKSQLIVLNSGYALRTGTRPGNGLTEPNGTYDGTYVRDFIFNNENGNLDEANGRFGVTPEFPGGTYYYVITDEFPSIPRFFVGTPDASFKVGGGNKPSEGDSQNGTPPTSGDSEKLKRFNRLDANNDNRISKSEAKGPILERFDKLDKNNDEFISLDEFIKH